MIQLELPFPEPAPEGSEDEIQIESPLPEQGDAWEQSLVLSEEVWV